jgi:Rod binding domain-containing protein
MGGLPPIDSSQIPGAVRKAGSAEVQKYETALSFEGMLDEQLAQSLTDTLQPSTTDDDSSDGSDDSSTDAGTSLTLQMLPQALSQGLIASGGIGLAGQLYTDMGGTANVDGATGSPS